MLLLSVVTPCALEHSPPPWTHVDRRRAADIREVAVLGARHERSVAGCLMTMTKALIDAFRSSGRFRVRSYREVLIALQDPEVDVAPDSVIMETTLVRRLAERLSVDGVIVAWMSRCGFETGDALSVALFATADGARLGSFATTRSGLSAAFGSYSAAANAEEMAGETIAALLRALEESSN